MPSDIDPLANIPLIPFSIRKEWTFELDKIWAFLEIIHLNYRCFSSRDVI